MLPLRVSGSVEQLWGGDGASVQSGEAVLLFRRVKLFLGSVSRSSSSSSSGVEGLNSAAYSFLVVVVLRLKSLSGAWCVCGVVGGRGGGGGGGG